MGVSVGSGRGNVKSHLHDTAAGLHSTPCRVPSDEFVGLGQMGPRMAENILKKAHRLRAGGKLTTEWPEEAFGKIIQVNLEGVLE
jgi:hypothetical protein